MERSLLASLQLFLGELQPKSVDQQVRLATRKAILDFGPAYPVTQRDNRLLEELYDLIL